MSGASGTIYIAGGGTAGHLFPGLALADRLVEETPDAEIVFVGGGKHHERRMVTAGNYPYLALPCRPAPRRLRELFSSLATNYAGYLAACRILREEPAAAVVGLGGYASAAMAKAALACRVPLVLLEQNVQPGKVTRWLAPRATLTCVAFEAARENLPQGCRVRVTGNPLRPGFQRFPATEADPDAATDGQRRLLVLGGTHGARSLNEHVPRALYRLRSLLAGWQIVHQTGPADVDATRSAYAKLGMAAQVEPFLSDVPEQLAACGLAICRAGGTTLAELAAARVPAVLVPYPHAADAHQQRNAEVLAAAGACLTVDERKLAGRLEEPLAEAVGGLLENPTRRAEAAAAMARFARPHAAQEVAAVIRQIVVGRQGK